MENSDQSGSDSQAMPPFIAETSAKYGSDLAGEVSERLMRKYKHSPETAMTLSKIYGSDRVVRVVKMYGADASLGILEGVFNLCHYDDLTFHKRIKKALKFIDDKKVVKCIRRYRGPSAREIARTFVENTCYQGGNVEEIMKALILDEVVEASNKFEHPDVLGNLIGMARRSVDTRSVGAAARILGRYEEEYAREISKILFSTFRGHCSDISEDEKMLEVAVGIAKEVADHRPDLIHTAYYAIKATKDTDVAKAATRLDEKIGFSKDAFSKDAFSKDVLTIIENIQDKKAIIAAIDAIGRYKKENAISVADELKRLSCGKRGKDMVLKASSLMGSEKFCEFLDRYKVPESEYRLIYMFGAWADDDSVVEELFKIASGLNKDTIHGITSGIAHLGRVEDKSRRSVDFSKVKHMISDLYERDPTTTCLAVKNFDKILEIFGDKFDSIFDYLWRRRDRDSILTIERISKKVSGALGKIKTAEFGNKQAKRLIRLASYLDACYQLDLNPEVSEDLQASYDGVENTLKDYFKSLGINDFRKGIKFIDWVKEKNETVQRVLNGEKIEKPGLSRIYRLKNSEEVDIEGIRKEIQSYADMAGLPTKVEGETLAELKEAAEQIMSDVSKKKGLDENVVREIKPNLSRILNITYRGSREYVLSVDSSDMEAQLEALQNIPSCLSPGGSNFEFTKQYLKNPNTFWATVREENKDGTPGKVVGRVTIFRGKRDEKDVIARVSRVYSTAPIDKVAVDEVLREYAKESGAEFTGRGKIKVGGLERIYDDYASGLDGTVSLAEHAIT